MSEQHLTKLIKKMFNIIKPKGVSDIVFNLEPLGIRDDEYYLNIKYVVPDDSKFLTLNPFSVDKDSRYHWNHQIKKTIKNYIGVNVTINSSDISSESFYNKQKEK